MQMFYYMTLGSKWVPIMKKNSFKIHLKLALYINRRKQVEETYVTLHRSGGKIRIRRLKRSAENSLGSSRSQLRLLLFYVYIETVVFNRKVPIIFTIWVLELGGHIFYVFPFDFWRQFVSLTLHCSVNDTDLGGKSGSARKDPRKTVLWSRSGSSPKHSFLEATGSYLF